MEARSKKIKTYIRANGKSPFEDWVSGLRDRSAKAKIFTRIDRMKFGNFGDGKSIGQGVFELRVHLGSGYRDYFGLVGSEVVLLLIGGESHIPHELDCCYIPLRLQTTHFDPNLINSAELSSDPTRTSHPTRT